MDQMIFRKKQHMDLTASEFQNCENAKLEVLKRVRTFNLKNPHNQMKLILHQNGPPKHSTYIDGVPYGYRPLLHPGKLQYKTNEPTFTVVFHRNMGCAKACMDSIQPLAARKSWHRFRSEMGGRFLDARRGMTLRLPRPARMHIITLVWRYPTGWQRYILSETGFHVLYLGMFEPALLAFYLLTPLLLLVAACWYRKRRAISAKDVYLPLAGSPAKAEVEVDESGLKAN